MDENPKIIFLHRAWESGLRTTDTVRAVTLEFGPLRLLASVKGRELSSAPSQEHSSKFH